MHKSIKENNANSRKLTFQAVVISFIIIIFGAIRIKFELEKKNSNINNLNEDTQSNELVVRELHEVEGSNFIVTVVHKNKSVKFPFKAYK